MIRANTRGDGSLAQPLAGHQAVVEAQAGRLEAAVVPVGRLEAAVDLVGLQEAELQALLAPLEPQELLELLEPQEQVEHLEDTTVVSMEHVLEEDQRVIAIAGRDPNQALVSSLEVLCQATFRVDCTVELLLTE